MNFSEAIPHLYEGKRIRLPHWKSQTFSTEDPFIKHGEIENIRCFIKVENGLESIYKCEEIDSNDWEIAE
jgi:hypothetical protein